MAPLSLSDIGQVSQANCGQLTEQLTVKNREQLQPWPTPRLLSYTRQNNIPSKRHVI